MGNRTLSLGLIWRALFLDSAAYDELRDDDNPFVEGLFLVVLIGLVTALISFIGRILMWAGSPTLSDMKETIWKALPQLPQWSEMVLNARVAEEVKKWYDLGWQVFPVLFGVPEPGSAAANVLVWPITLALSWLVYGLLAHLFLRMLGGAGRLGETLGTLSLAFTPFLLRGLGFLPYFTIGAVLNTWQLLCRYKAIRSAGRLSWGRAVWATLLPFAVYLLFWIIVGVVGVLGIAAAASAAEGR